MFETKDISLLALGAAVTAAIACLQALQTKQLKWAGLYAVVGLLFVIWGFWPLLTPTLSHVFEFRGSPVTPKNEAANRFDKTITSIAFFIGMASNLLRRFVAKHTLRAGAFMEDAMNAMVLCTAIIILVGPFFFRAALFDWLVTPAPTHMITGIYLVALTGKELFNFLFTSPGATTAALARMPSSR